MVTSPKKNFHSTFFQPARSDGSQHEWKEYLPQADYSTAGFWLIVLPLSQSSLRPLCVKHELLAKGKLSPVVQLTLIFIIPCQEYVLICFLQTYVN
jgi:hypothetical protein